MRLSNAFFSNTWGYSIVGCFLVSLLLAPAVKADTRNKSASFKLGIVLGLTGDAFVQSDAIRKGAQLAIDDLKKQGIRIEARFEDDQTNPAKTVSSFKFLLSQGYNFFVGPTWSFQAKAVRQTLESENALAIQAAGSSLINGGASKAFFNLCPRRDKQVEPIKNWLSTKEMPRAMVLTPNGDWGDVHEQVFLKALKEARQEPVAVERYDYKADTAFFRSIFLRAKSRDFNLVLTTGSPADLSNLVKAKRQLGLSSSILATHDLVDALNLGLLNRSEISGELFISQLKKPSKDFQKRFRSRFGESAKLYSDRAYDGVMALAVAISETDGTVDQVRDYFSNKLDIAGTIGRIRFDQNGDLAEQGYQVIALD